MDNQKKIAKFSNFHRRKLFIYKKDIAQQFKIKRHKEALYY